MSDNSNALVVTETNGKTLDPDIGKAALSSVFDVRQNVMDSDASFLTKVAFAYAYRTVELAVTKKRLNDIREVTAYKSELDKEKAKKAADEQHHREMFLLEEQTNNFVSDRWSRLIASRRVDSLADARGLQDFRIDVGNESMDEDLKVRLLDDALGDFHKNLERRYGRK